MTVEAARPQELGAARPVAMPSSRLGWAYAALVALMAAPIAIWPIPYSWDLVNHWARLTLYGAPAGDPLAALYRIRLTLIPNLAIDLVYLALAPVFSPESVIRLAWVAAFALPAWGTWRLSRALFGAPQPIVLIAPALSYNLVTTLGLVNFALGMGLAIHALVWWLTIDRRRLWTRVALFNFMAALLFFCHIAAYAGFCLIVGLLDVAPWRGGAWREWLGRSWATPLCVASGAVLWLFAVPFDSRFGGRGIRLLSLAAPMLDDKLGLAFLATIALIIALILALNRGVLTLAPAMRWPLAGLLVAIAAAPPSIGAADYIGSRMAVFFAYLVVASLGGPSAGAATRWLGLAAAAVVLARVGAIAPTWAAFERSADDFRQAIRAVAPGSRTLVVEPPTEACPLTSAMIVLRGLPNFIVIDRRALVSTLFTGRGMQPVRMADPRMNDTPWVAVRPAWLALHDGSRGGANWREVYDTAIVVHGDCAWRLEAPGLTQIGESREATIYRIQ
jgi:hypothetical protein